MPLVKEHYLAYALRLWQSVAYPLFQAASDLIGREALLGELQVLLPAVQHVLVDGRPKLDLCTFAYRQSSTSTASHRLPQAGMPWDMQLFAGYLHVVVHESRMGVGRTLPSSLSAPAQPGL